MTNGPLTLLAEVGLPAARFGPPAAWAGSACTAEATSSAETVAASSRHVTRLCLELDMMDGHPSVE